MVVTPIVPKVIVDAPSDFLDLESSSGILLLLAAVLALVVANSPLAPFHAALTDLPAGIRISDLEIEKPLLS